ncbi:MAG: AtpZ/AtpI family protein [Gracilimonas sp.]|uniref:AtpZ/AtpI family protein n=1 Tax=Gracilimonas sp. TaxID=1974203 RepID=UPI0019CDBFBA|nr:AtpZ/AtpI family protein [Gracilimonas sp.]MBD3616019.1 AtpZ/AtpI family protein [Gracilimonas sp.]
MSNNFLPEKYAEYLGLGAEIAVSLIIPILTGYYLDEYFDTSPILILIGVLLAMIAFGFTVTRITKKLDQGNNE